VQYDIDKDPKIMSKVNYDEISQVYDDVRQADIELINSFLREIDFDKEIRVLDIGSGTGNHTDLLQKLTNGEVYGVEPSEGMLGKAKAKESKVVFKHGNADELPFDDEYFDFVYMTDVIHHVPDIEAMFAEIKRVLKVGGQICIVTQSHQQIENRPIVKYFPGTARVDIKRYPKIDEIIVKAEGQGFKFNKKTILYEDEKMELGEEYLELVKKKGYSMLHLIPDEEYYEGLKKLETALMKGRITARLSGETMVWLVKA
jgi:ubiquinone/menaquinone biosynthesis C-methylase UbiE